MDSLIARTQSGVHSSLPSEPATGKPAAFAHRLLRFEPRSEQDGDRILRRWREPIASAAKVQIDDNRRKGQRLAAVHLWVQGYLEWAGNATI